MLFQKGTTCLFGTLGGHIKLKHSLPLCKLKGALIQFFWKLTTFFVVKEAHVDVLGFSIMTYVFEVKVTGEILHS